MPTKSELILANDTNIRNKTADGSITRGAIADGLLGALNYADERISTVQATAAGYIVPGQRLLVPKERFTCQSGVWTTIASGVGIGVLDSFWLAILSGNGTTGTTGSGDVATCKMRVAFDGEAVPSMFGTNGAPMTDWFCFGGAETRPLVYENERMAVTTDTPIEFGGILEVDAPFSNGFTVEFYNTCPNTVDVWAQFEYSDSYAAFDFDPLYRLKAQVSVGSPAPAQAHTFFDMAGDIILLGYLQHIDASALNVPWTYEGNTAYYYNQQAAAGFATSGTEDGYKNSYTWENKGPNATLSRRFVPYFNVNNKKLWGGIFYAPRKAPRATTHLTLKYFNGDGNYHTPPGAIISRTTTFAYVKQATVVIGGGGNTGGGSTTVQQLTTPFLALAPQPGADTASWTASPGAGSYLLEYATAANGPWTQAYSGGNLSYTLTGLTDGIIYYFRVSAQPASGSTSYTASGYSTASAQYAGSNLELSLDPQLASGNSAGLTLTGGMVSNWKDQAAGVNFAAPSGGYPIYVPQNAAFNNQPTVRLTGTQHLELLNTSLAAETTFTLYVVVLASGYQVILSNRVGSADYPSFLVLQNNAVEVSNSGVPAPALWAGANGVCKIIAYCISPTLIEVYESNVLVASLQNPGTYDSGTRNLSLGGNVTNNGLSQGATLDLGKLDRYNGTHTAAQRKATYNALATRFGLLQVS